MSGRQQQAVQSQTLTPPTNPTPHPTPHLLPQQQMLASENTPGVPSRYEWVQEAYEQLLLCKYDAHP